MKIPKLSIVLSLISFALFYLSNDHQFWYFDVEKILRGEYWRLISGHFIHADQKHLEWNLTALVILGFIVEQKSSRCYIPSLLFGIVVIDLALLSSWTQLDVYCGLSGALNSLLVLALWQEWKRQQSFWILCLGLVCLLKIILEIHYDQAIFTQFSWPSYPNAHLLGFLAGLVFLMLPLLYKKGVQK